MTTHWCESLTIACAFGLIAGATCAQSKPEPDHVAPAVDLEEPQNCVQLNVRNLVGGELATFYVTGGEPGEWAGIMWSLELGEFAGQWTTWCYDFDLAINSRATSHIVMMAPFNENGFMSQPTAVPEHASGYELHFQAAVRATCPESCMSNVYSEVVG